MRIPSLVVAAFLLAALDGAAAPPAVTLQPFVSGFSNPVEITHARDHSGRLFVVEQGGRIRIVRNAQVLLTPFLDISPANGGPVLFGGEQGLLGLAFHPQYAANGFFYVFYNRVRAGDPSGNEVVVARYQRSANNPDLADPASGTVLFFVPHPSAPNHNGGKLAFRRDGALYISIGDGGTGGNAAQAPGDLRGRILRLDVDTPGALPSVWAMGLRNPWRFSFDRLTADMYIADVGQSAWEEIDFEPVGSPGGRNYGWPAFEATHCYVPSTGCSVPGHVPPVIEYPHDSTGGFSVTGGYVYRGTTFPALQGYYVYGDYVSGNMWGARQSEGWTPGRVGSSPNLSAFGEDESGELYVANLVAGTISRVTPAASTLPRLGNISSRARVLTGEDVMIAGFAVSGGPGIDAKRVVISVAGPSLANFGVATPLANPELAIVRASDQVVIASNDDWQNQAAGNVAAIQASGLQPNQSLEPAVVLDLAPGNYTAIVSGVNGGVGTAVVGIFEVDHPENPLVNISSRARVQGGNDVLIGGFIISGTQPKQVVVNVAGPSLVAAGVASPLANPTLTVVRASDNFIMGTNDDWQSQASPGDVAAIQATGFQPNHPAESALILNLLPGAYTAIVQGAGGTTGVALVGAFALP